MDTSTVSAEFTDFATAASPRLFRTALLLTGDWQLAEDLVQTTLAKVYVAWGRVSAADSPEAYSQRILTNAFLSWRRTRTSGEIVTEQIRDSGDAGPDVATRLAVLTALRRLAPLDRSVVVLRYWEDHSVAQTASVLGITEAAVKMRTMRSLGRLRSDLGSLKEGA